MIADICPANDMMPGKILLILAIEASLALCYKFPLYPLQLLQTYLLNPQDERNPNQCRWTVLLLAVNARELQPSEVIYWHTKTLPWLSSGMHRLKTHVFRPLRITVDFQNTHCPFLKQSTQNQGKPSPPPLFRWRLKTVMILLLWGEWLHQSSH